MKMNPKQRAAIFEKLKKTGKLKTKNPFATKEPKPPKMPQVASSTKMSNRDKVDENYIGKVRPARFKKLKTMFGLD